MERKITFEEGEIYHVYNRGVEKRPIYRNKTDMVRFHKLLYLANSSQPFCFDNLSRGTILWQYARGETIVDLGLYALMDNHFHILLREKKKGGISKFMLKLTTAYSMYFNTKYERSGPLFTKPFKARLVDDDSYLEYLFVYIHLNPLTRLYSDWKEKGVRDLMKSKQYLERYPFSSYQDYLGISRGASAILNPAPFSFLENKLVDYKTLIYKWIDFREGSPPG